MSHEEVEFSRDCDAVQIPQGIKVTIPQGTLGVVTQALGDTYTLQLPTLGGLYRVSDSDADAIGKESKGPVPEAPTGTGGKVSEDQVWAQLKNVYDPEIPVNIVDLGLVYDLAVGDLPEGGTNVDVKMTLTAQGCGMGHAIAMDAQMRIKGIPGVEDANVEIVWDPPWTPALISPEGKEKMGLD